MTALETPGLPTDDAVLDERARLLARSVAARPLDAELHLIVRVGASRLAVPAARARHVTGPQPLAALPAGAAPIVGVAPILGQNVAVVDLGTLLDVVASAPVARRSLLVVDDGEESLALLVDAIETLTMVETAAITAASADATGRGELTGDAAGGLRVLRVDALLAALPPVDTHLGIRHAPGAET